MKIVEKIVWNLKTGYQGATSVCRSLFLTYSFVYQLSYKDTIHETSTGTTNEKGSTKAVTTSQNCKNISGIFVIKLYRITQMIKLEDLNYM